MNTNEKCLLNYLSDYSKSTFEASVSLVNFLTAHDRKIQFNNLNPVCNIIDEMEFSAFTGYNSQYEQKNTY